MSGFKGAATPLTSKGLEACAGVLSIGPVEIWTVLTVETRGCGFLADGRPAILYERHVFDRLTKGRFRSPDNESISAGTAGGYSGGRAEYGRLERAMRLDRTAALESASWGLGQVMGFHARKLGFGSVEDFVGAMMESEDNHLVAFSRFLLMNGLGQKLRAHDWAGFARGYNGPAYARNSYDEKLEEAFEKLSNRPLPDLLVREAQVRLLFLGFEPGPPDGIIGPRTRDALRQFQEQRGLPSTRELDEATLRALQARCAALP